MMNSHLRVRRSELRSVFIVMVVGLSIGILLFVTIAPKDSFYLIPGRRGIDSIGDIGHVPEDNIPDKVLKFHGKDEIHHKDEDKEAQRLFSEIKVLCWIMTRPETHDKKAKHVRATWGKRCNKLIFMSSQNDTELGAIDLLQGDGRDKLWGKTRAAFKYVYEHHLNDYDWFFKADDDTYTIMENMRYFLASYEPKHPIYFGSRFNKFSKQGYMSGGGGYVLSKEALKKFVEVAMPDDKVCRTDPGGAEDAEMGKCLNNIGVMAGDSRDSLGRGRFFPFDPATHLMGGVPDWYLDYVYYKPDTGLDCCSDTPVTFHYVSTEKMYELEYLLYHSRPYGIAHHDPYPAPLPMDRKSIPKDILIKNGLPTPGDDDKENAKKDEGKKDDKKEDEKKEEKTKEEEKKTEEENKSRR